MKSTPLQRSIDLKEKAFMPWDQAFKLALEEDGIGDAEIDELIGNATPSAITDLLDDEEVREFVRSILVHQYALQQNADGEPSLLARQVPGARCAASHVCDCQEAEQPCQRMERGAMGTHTD